MNFKKIKWIEDIIAGIVNVFFSFFLLFNGFSKLAKHFLVDGIIVNGPTKQKGFIAFLSLLEKSWLKYLLIAFLLFASFMFFKEGYKKFKIWRDLKNTA